MSRILVAYYSRTGNTQGLAERVAEGAREAGAEVAVQTVAQTEVSELLDYDGIILGSPTYYGLPAAPLKQFLDESVQLHGRLAGRVGGAFATAENIGGGNETAILAILQAMLVHGMVIQGSHAGDHYGPVAVGEPDQRAATMARHLGERVAALAERLAD